MEEKKIELKGLKECSEEVEAVMGQTPPWVFRWGITIIAVVVGGLLASTWLVHWPDTQTANGCIDVTESSDKWAEMVIRLRSEQIRLLRDGMEARVSLDVKDEEWGYYQANVMSIPLMTDSTGMYPVHLRMNKYEKTTEGHASIAELINNEIHTSSRNILEVTITITLSNKRLLQRLLKSE